MFLLSILFLAVTHISYGDDKSDEQKTPTGEDHLTTLMELAPTKQKSLSFRMLKLLPPNQRQGVIDYLSVLGISANGGQNSGIVNYNLNLLDAEDGCLKELAGEFYASVHIDSAKYMVEKYKKGNTALSMRFVSLNDRLDSTSLKPGWLWEKALSFAQGDKNLALQLIGLCGHDDTAQLYSRTEVNKNKSESDLMDLNYYLPLPKDRQVLNKYKETLAESVKVMQSLHEELNKKYNMQEAFHSDQWDGTKGVQCPFGNNPMFMPEALGTGYEIPEKLRNKIIAVQAPTKGGSALPSKSYHIMGAAYTSCFLLRRGVPAFIAKKAALGAINAYRAGRICQEMQYDESTLNKSLDEILADVDWARAHKKECEEQENKPQQCWIMWKIIESEVLFDSDITTEIIHQKVRSRVARIDAKSFFKSSLTYKLVNCEGPQITEGVYDYLAKHGESGSKNPCPKGFDPVRCKAARHMMDTWVVDFEWSKAQHTAGFEFAVKNCQPLKPGEDPSSMACKVLGRKPGRTNTSNLSTPVAK